MGVLTDLNLNHFGRFFFFFPKQTFSPTEQKYNLLHTDLIRACNLVSLPPGAVQKGMPVSLHSRQFELLHN